MTPQAPALALSTVAQDVLGEVFRRELLFASTALCFAALILPTLVAMAVDGRTVNGVNIWVKPLKFEVSLLLYIATLAWFAGWLPQGVTQSGWYQVFSIAVVAAIAAEMIWIGGAAAFGVASHFNNSSPLMGKIYGLMGLLAVLLTSATLVYGVLILSGGSRLDPAFALSVGLGLVLTFVLTLPVAGYMASGSGALVGDVKSATGALPLLGWSTTVGDLRVAHFFATHAMHVIPVSGYVLALVLPTLFAKGAVIAISAAYVGLVAFTFVQALSGRPFIG